MTNVRISSLLIIILIALSVSSCEAIAGIFKAGMGFGIFLVIAVIAGILFLVFRSGKKTDWISYEFFIIHKTDAAKKNVVDIIGSQAFLFFW